MDDETPPEFHRPGSGDELRDFDVPREIPDNEFGRRLLAKYRGKLPYYGSPETRPIQFANGFAELAAVAFAKAEFYGALLASEFERIGVDSLIGWEMAATAATRDSDPEIYKKNEMVRALVQLEAAERDRAAALTEKGIRLGMEASKVDAMRSYGKTVAEFARAMAAEFGLDWNAEPTRRGVQRALLTARQKLGFELKPPGAAGAPRTEEERAGAPRDPLTIELPGGNDAQG
jgi:hypothetical protein